MRWSDEAISRALGAAIQNKAGSPELENAVVGTENGVGDRVPDSRFAGEAMGFGAAAANPSKRFGEHIGRLLSSPLAGGASAPQARPGRGEVA